MAAVDASRNRRGRTATYGKASRRRIEGYGPAGPPLTSESPGLSLWPDQAETEVAVGKTSSSSLSRRIVKSPETTRAQEPGSKGKLRSTPKMATKHSRERLNKALGSGNESPLSRERGKPTNDRAKLEAGKNRDAAVFDVPSSDEEPLTPKTTSKRSLAKEEVSPSAWSLRRVTPFGVPTKSNQIGVGSSEPSPRKRKRPAAREREEHAAVFDDNTLQTRVALESSATQTAIPEKTKRASTGIESLSQATKRERRLDRANKPPKSPASRARYPETRRDATKIHQGSLSGNICRGEGSCPSQPEAGKSATSPKGFVSASEAAGPESYSPPSTPHRSDLTKHSSPMSITPKRLNDSTTQPTLLSPGGSSSTPRQAMLWQELLGDDSQAVSIGSELPGHLQTDCSGSDHTSRSTECSREKLRLRRYPRKSHKRLIDILATEEETFGDEPAQLYQSDSGSNSDSEPTRYYSQQPSTVTEVATAVRSPVETPNLPLAPPADTNPSYSQVAQTIVNGGPKITYARQRSHLTEELLNEELLLPISMDSGSEYRQSTRGGGGKEYVTALNRDRFKVNAEADGDAETTGIRSIYELREAGGNKRFLDEMEALFEDLEDRRSISLSKQRSSLLEICLKLLDQGFARRMVDHGLEQRLFDYLDFQNVISRFLLGSALCLLFGSSAVTHTVFRAREAETATFLISLLDVEDDITSLVKGRQSKLSKATQGLLIEYRNKLQKSSVWGTERPSIISLQIVGLRCLELLVCQSREAGNMELIISQGAFSKLFKLLLHHSEVPPMQESSKQRTLEVEYAISILESCTINTGSRADTLPWSNESLLGLANLLPILCCWPDEGSEKIQALALRLTLNLTNNNVQLCDAFSSPGLIKAIVDIVDVKFRALSETLLDDDRLHALDHLVLALGSLINFAEWSKESRAIIYCDRNCGEFPIDMLLGLFLEKLEKASEADSMEESHSNVAFGYLAVLLGNLCQDSEATTRVRSALPSKSLKPLISAIEEFLEYHKKVDDEIYEVEGDSDIHSGFTARLQSVVDRLKKVDQTAG
ncbi:MAG: hypothetical protein M1819_007240 [Sarea resinae]|nr:MAG: hypothetical protein M1819_007240 [Sarea resinae]